ncbi:rhodanese-like domain-containing protein [Gramella sp. GC03-9]|uniref:Rhodanese-like domain-containing protein n=1 Tax=Christiangramia oceanisediminis TaxID=2920386 RepID=A0A9X2I2E2_9FLAO|nr:rhodanese-like domain-containing protein [Gramella oceanisediminis]MCP9199969.1 rhodanese-like domain-containing protein [Gramella oceanisediminis]
MNKILIIMSLFTTLFGKAQEDENIKVLAPSEYESAVCAGEVQLVDVRTPGEFNQGAIENAQNLDFFNQKAFLAGLEKLDKNKPVYVYCKSGGRSQKAAQIMKKMGFSRIFDLEGGFSNYKF